MASLLVFALMFALWGRWKRGEGPRFVVGFEAFGLTVVLFVYVVLVAGFAARHPEVRAAPVPPTGAPEIATVYVPVFYTNTFRRDVPMMLTTAVVKEIE